MICEQLSGRALLATATIFAESDLPTLTLYPITDYLRYVLLHRQLFCIRITSSYSIQPRSQTPFHHPQVVWESDTL